MDLWYELAIRETVGTDGVDLNQEAAELRKDAQAMLSVPADDEADDEDE